MQSDQATRNSALVVACTAGALVPFMGSSVVVALPALGAEFRAGAVALGWVTTSFLLASAVLLLPLGRIADVLGRKKIFGWGIWIYTLGSAVCALSPSTSWLIAGRVVQGMGGAMLFGTNVAILVSVFPPTERGRVLGINVASVYVGLSIGPFVGGLVTQHLGWRSLFLLNVPICLFLFWLTFTRLKGEWAGAKGEGFDPAGSILYGLSMFMLIWGGTSLGRPGGLAAAAAGLGGLALFAAWEACHRSPVFDVRLFISNRVFMLSNAAALVNYSASAGSSFLLSLYLQYVKGMGPRAAGIILLMQPVMQALMAPYAGRLSDRIEPRFVASAGMALTAAGLGVLVLVGTGSPLALVVAGLILLGLGFGTFSSPNTNAIMGSVDQGKYGVASATVGTMRLTGQMASMGVVMAALSHFVGGRVVTPELHSAFTMALRSSCGIFLAFCLAGILMSLARGNVRRGGGSAASRGVRRRYDETKY